ncbi:hypothetical protein [Paraburkholderia rhizosphaerae]|uniref:Uncharacterized protein n=1 Tax=Paraburkholderia rhizosphaerae TaxID=480658 RepID=A0A4R8LVH8_9BURK|nr:hypothetical protein [Paraburkholderia rhizosphaerae]TDY51819.1 hypothetical protein BX592_106113 [Paraburkholderia rhizosphaerae]
MSTTDILGTLGSIFTILSFASSVFVGVAMATKKFRENIIKELKGRSFGAATLEQLAKTWVMIFERYFGDRVLSIKQLLTIPIYTLTVSCVYIGVWVLHNIHGDITAIFRPFSPLMRQSLHDYFHEAIFVALVVDIFSISLTRVAIRAGRVKGYLSIRFFLLFALAVVASFFAFTFGLFFLRVLDMVRLYTDIAPQDPMPIMPYKPIDGFSVLFNLFNAPTVIHVTSRGWFATYFIPEPVLFYTALTTQLSFVFIIASHLLAKFTLFVRQASIKMLQTAGTTAGAASGIFASMLLWMLAITFFCAVAAFH